MLSSGFLFWLCYKTCATIVVFMMKMNRITKDTMKMVDAADDYSSKVSNIEVQLNISMLTTV